MIRSQDQLRAALAEGRTVSKLALFGEVKGFRLADTVTGETVSRAAVDRLVAKGELAVISTDICGDPMQWGRSQ